MDALSEKSLEKVFSVAGSKLDKLIRKYPDRFPMYTKNGKWNLEGETWTNWCEGFLGGQLWLLYLLTRESHWREQAEHYSLLIEPRKTDRDVHDLGFLFWPTWKRWYDLTGDKRIQNTVIEAGQTLALRFQENGQYLRSFLSQESLFIDIMMNVGIIFYAAQQTGDKHTWELARKHVDTTRKYLVRGDGSTAHEGIFNLESGEFLHQSTQQGWRNDSSWARGLAWALYGFGTVYTFTQNPRDLATAEACARYYIDHTPSHGIPPNDWDEPSPVFPFESSAAAIAAGGFLQLAKLSQDLIRAKYYHSYCERILTTLTSANYLAEEDEWDGILKHGIYHQRKGLGVDESVMWGEYFFLETVYKVLKNG